MVVKKSEIIEYVDDDLREAHDLIKVVHEYGSWIQRKNVLEEVIKKKPSVEKHLHQDLRVLNEYIEMFKKGFFLNPEIRSRSPRAIAFVFRTFFHLGEIGKEGYIIMDPLFFFCQDAVKYLDKGYRDRFMIRVKQGEKSLKSRGVNINIEDGE